MSSDNRKIIIVGGGAAGFFAANNLLAINPNCRIIILEKTSKILSKVKVSGGGRCNVTHHEFASRLFAKNYPRGEKKVQNPMKDFGAKETIDWFHQRGVDLKVENDGRMFPVSNSSQTIIDCFTKLLDSPNVELIQRAVVEHLSYENEKWSVTTGDEKYDCDDLIIACGSDKRMLEVIERDLGHTIVPQVPSLFTFNIKDDRLKDLQGLSFENADLKIQSTKLNANGPLLITHWGLSGPGILRLSAWGARILSDQDYDFKLMVNFTGDLNFDQCREELLHFKAENRQKKISKYPQFGIPRRYWERVVEEAAIEAGEIWAEISKKQLNKLATELSQAEFEVKGKSTFKDEFVTAGGVSLSEIDFKTFGSRLHPQLYFAGEVLDIDAITGGFNFQACWTGGYIAAKTITHE